jgi:hypothetical protein
LAGFQVGHLATRPVYLDAAFEQGDGRRKVRRRYIKPRALDDCHQVWRLDAQPVVRSLRDIVKDIPLSLADALQRLRRIGGFRDINSGIGRHRNAGAPLMQLYGRVGSHL